MNAGLDSLSVSHPHKTEIRLVAKDLSRVDLFPILESLMPVKFCSGDEIGSASGGEILVGEMAGRAERNGAPHVSSLTLPESGRLAEPGKLTRIKVQFADHADVPFPFRGRSLSVKVAATPGVLVLRERDRVLAETEQGPVWSVSRANGATHFRSAAALPVIPSSGSLCDVLNGERFLEILPVLHFLRCVSGDYSYESPALRAQFMFDDPNLHWPRYGCVGYRETATRAERENYHVSFATIPLDAWYVHGRTAEIFRNHPTRLSLCVHGNDHTKRELAQHQSQSARVSLLRQALRRIEGLERKAGVPVSRVMVPPHGACLHEMLEELPRIGFEAACISHGSLRAHNKTRPWTRSLGYLPAEMIGDCPVLPRWALANSTENTVLLAAFLRQPIILRGHHQDLKNGIELLDGFARIVNGLGNVIWSNMTEISQLNYFSRVDGNTIRLRPLGRKLTVHLPESVTGLLIEPPVQPKWDTWRITTADGATTKARSEERISLPGQGKRPVTIQTVPPAVGQSEDPGKPLAATAFLRRLLTEGRDRLIGAQGRN